MDFNLQAELEIVKNVLILARVGARVFFLMEGFRYISNIYIRIGNDDRIANVS